jgi:hypothetical protein
MEEQAAFIVSTLHIAERGKLFELYEFDKSHRQQHELCPEKHTNTPATNDGLRWGRREDWRQSWEPEGSEYFSIPSGFAGVDAETEQKS